MIKWLNVKFAGIVSQKIFNNFMQNNIYYIFVLVFGLIIGSFLNCVIYRLERNEKLSGRSYCPNCKHTLNWLDLIPVFSFLFLAGKCRYCRAKISIQYPLIELLTGILYVLIFWSLGFHWAIGIKMRDLINLLFSFYIISALIVIFVYDLKHYLIPDKVLFPAIIITFLYRFLDNLLNWDIIGNYIFAALIAFVFFLAIYLISKGRWMGFGDVKLAILLGLILGFPDILVGLFLAFFFGAIIGVGAIFLSLPAGSQAKIGFKSEIPFGPFLITGTLITMFWGQQIIDFYLSFFAF